VPSVTRVRRSRSVPPASTTFESVVLPGFAGSKSKRMAAGPAGAPAAGSTCTTARRACPWKGCSKKIAEMYALPATSSANLVWSGRSPGSMAMRILAGS
jgi:hypothetical protein